jgi:carboxyl-terminal processing protease
LEDKPLYRALQVVAFLSVLVLVAVASFTMGVLADNQGLIPITGWGLNGTGVSAQSSENLDVGLIQEAYSTIQNHYADRETLTDTNLTYSAITGMVEALGDTGHSRFLTPEMVKQEDARNMGEFEGIGALLNVNEAGNPVILTPMDGSPAQKAGLRPGDIILAVNGEDVSQAPLSEVVRRVLGPAGTDVTLTIQDPDTDEIRDVTITRAKIVLENVTWQMLPGTKIAHLRLAAFSQDVSDDLIQALNDIQDQGAQGILLDMRNNPGGYLHEAVAVVSQFLKEGDALRVKDADGNERSMPINPGGVATEIPLVVLINQGSASAAEITAGALQDYGRATLVGKTTFGTGTVLNRFRLPDGSALLLATELWLTPKGRVIWHEGIDPDIEMDLPEDIAPSIPETERELTAEELQKLDDVQRLRGLEILQEKIK